MIVLHDSEPELRALLRSIAPPAGARRSSIVVDSGSRDGGPALAAEHGAEVIALAGNPGFGAAATRHRVRDAAGHGVLNPDSSCSTRPRPAGGRRPAGGALHAPRLLNADGSVQDSAHPLPGRLGHAAAGAAAPPLLPRAAARFEPWRSDRTRAVGWAIAACILGATDKLRRSARSTRDAFLFYEDIELACERGAPGCPRSCGRTWRCATWAAPRRAGAAEERDLDRAPAAAAR